MKVIKLKGKVAKQTKCLDLVQIKARGTFEEAADRLEFAKSNFWLFIHNEFPETEDGVWCYNRETNEIMQTLTKEQAVEKMTRMRYPFKK